MDTYTTLKLDRQDGVALVTLHRPQEANAVDPRMAAELEDVASECDGDDTVRAVVVTGEGRFFCAGGDLRQLAGLGTGARSGIKRMADRFHTAISAFSRMKAPVITAVNGVCAGAGFSLAISGDLVLASDRATFSMGYGAVGLSPNGSSSYFLPRLIGMRRAQELMLTSRKLAAQEALAWGLVTEVVSGDVLLSTALQRARSIAAGAVEANAAVKRLLHASYGNGLETQMQLEGRLITDCVGSADGREGIAAFLEKRAPRFQ